MPAACAKRAKLEAAAGVSLLIVGIAPATHRVHQVVGGRVALADRTQRAPVEHVGAVDRDSGIEADPARIARDTPDRLSERMELTNESASYVTGGSGDERAHHAERTSIRCRCGMHRTATASPGGWPARAGGLRGYAGFY